MQGVAEQVQSVDEQEQSDGVAGGSEGGSYPNGRSRPSGVVKCKASPNKCKASTNKSKATMGKTRSAKGTGAGDGKDVDTLGDEERKYKKCTHCEKRSRGDPAHAKHEKNCEYNPKGQNYGGVPYTPVAAGGASGTDAKRVEREEQVEHDDSVTTLVDPNPVAILHEDKDNPDLDTDVVQVEGGGAAGGEGEGEYNPMTEGGFFTHKDASKTPLTQKLNRQQQAASAAKIPKKTDSFQAPHPANMGGPGSGGDGMKMVENNGSADHTDEQHWDGDPQEIAGQRGQSGADSGGATLRRALPQVRFDATMPQLGNFNTGTIPKSSLSNPFTNPPNVQYNSTDTPPIAVGANQSQEEFQKAVLAKLEKMDENQTKTATKRDVEGFARDIARIGAKADEALRAAETAFERSELLEGIVRRLEEVEDRLSHPNNMHPGAVSDSYITQAQASVNAQEIVLEMRRKERNLVFKGVREYDAEDVRELLKNAAIWLADKMYSVYHASYKDRLPEMFWDQFEGAKRVGTFNQQRRFPRDVVVTFSTKEDAQKVLKAFAPIRAERINRWEEYKRLPKRDRDRMEPPPYYDILEDYPNYTRNRGYELRDIAKVVGCGRSVKKEGRVALVQLPRGDYRLALLEDRGDTFAEIQSEAETEAEAKEILKDQHARKCWDLKGARAYTKLGEHMPALLPPEIKTYNPLVVPPRMVTRWRASQGQGPPLPPLAGRIMRTTNQTEMLLDVRRSMQLIKKSSLAMENTEGHEEAPEDIATDTSTQRSTSA